MGTETTSGEVKRSVLAFVALAQIYLDAIGVKGSAGIPSGHLYAMVMGSGVSLETHQRVIALLKESGRVTEVNHLLKANGGAL